MWIANREQRLAVRGPESGKRANRKASSAATEREAQTADRASTSCRIRTCDRRRRDGTTFPLASSHPNLTNGRHAGRSTCRRRPTARQSAPTSREEGQPTSEPQAWLERVASVRALDYHTSSSVSSTRGRIRLVGGCFFPTICAAEARCQGRQVSASFVFVHSVFRGPHAGWFAFGKGSR
jgi:hypothetical protein